MQASVSAHRRALLRLAAIVGGFALLLAAPALSRAEESNPNNYTCIGKIGAGEAEEGNEEQQVKYSFYCDGQITGYQLESNVPVTGAPGSPLLSTLKPGFLAGEPLKDTFSCSGEIPGWAVNCVGSTKTAYELVTGQFSIEKKLCVEPREDPLLTVTYAYLEKGVVTQAISGPFDLGRPGGCKPDKYSGSTRLEPKGLNIKKKKHKKSAKKSAHKARKSSRAHS